MDRAAFSLTPFAAAIGAVAAAFLFLVPAARSDTSTVIWTTPTPKDQARFTVDQGKRVTLKLAAATFDGAGIVHIAPAQRFPTGVSFNSSDGLTASALFSWTPEAAGDYKLRFSASLVGSTGVGAPPVTYLVHVKGPAYPLKTTLTDSKVARWGQVLSRAVVHTQPNASARAMTRLDTMTTDGTHNIVLVLEQQQTSPTQTWYRVRLPILPNNSTGWVQSTALGPLYAIHTHLYVDRAHLTITLKKDGKTIFKSIVGVGRSIWPTPRGEFYVRDKLTSFNDPFYGPIAFGTSARSATLTDWPGGGFVGVHGTNQPGILPGRVSHGCIRMRNPAILKLAKLMPVGTPLTVT
jgi:L,D-transpeptidase catalytic domain/GW (Gly-Tryp) dipeptide domain